MPLAAKISARSGTSTRGARTFNVVSDGRNGEVRKRPALVYSNGYGGLGSGLMETPNGLFSAWDHALVDETGDAHIVGSGTLSGLIVAGWSDLFITGMSDDGQTCSGYGTKAGVGIRAVKLTKTTLTELTYPSGVTGSTWAYGISGDGNTIVGAGFVSATQIMRAYKWVGVTATQIAVANSAYAGIDSGAYGVNYDGSVICGNVARTALSGLQQGFIYRNGSTTYRSLASPHNSNTYLFCVSSDGVWVGGSATNSSTARREALIYNGTTEIYPDPGTSAIISGLSNDGRYSSGIYYSGPYSFFYDKTTASLTTLDVTSGYPYTIHATGISRYGNAVVGEMEIDVNTYVMFRWTPSGGYENLGKIPETADGSGNVANAQFPKIGGCSALGTTVAVTQFNVSTRTPAFWTPD